MPANGLTEYVPGPHNTQSPQRNMDPGFAEVRDRIEPRGQIVLALVMIEVVTVGDNMVPSVSASTALKVMAGCSLRTAVPLLPGSTNEYTGVT